MSARNRVPTRKTDKEKVLFSSALPFSLLASGTKPQIPGTDATPPPASSRPTPRGPDPPVSTALDGTYHLSRTALRETPKARGARPLSLVQGRGPRHASVVVAPGEVTLGTDLTEPIRFPVVRSALPVIFRLSPHSKGRETFLPFRGKALPTLRFQWETSEAWGSGGTRDGLVGCLTLA